MNFIRASDCDLIQNTSVWFADIHIINTPYMVKDLNACRYKLGVHISFKVFVLLKLRFLYIYTIFNAFCYNILFIIKFPFFNNQCTIYFDFPMLSVVCIYILATLPDVKQ